MTTANSPGVSASHFFRINLVDLHTKTVSRMEEPVPLICIDAAISAGQGMDAEQVRPCVEDRHCHGIIGFDLVVMICEGKRRARFQSFRHFLENSGQTVGEVVEPPAHIHISGQFVGLRVDSAANACIWLPASFLSQT